MDLPSQLLPKTYPQFTTEQYAMFPMSGTSQVAPVTTGVVALRSQPNPRLTPDHVKCRLIASASAALAKDGRPAYTLFQQGAGRVDAYAAVYRQAANCANQGLNIAADVAGNAHDGAAAHPVDQLDGTVPLDPWVYPYEYVNFAARGLGEQRLHRGKALNSDYDLYTRGGDGQTDLMINAASADDDIVRGRDGDYVGLASDF